jgi:ferrous iron transport protein B
VQYGPNVQNLLHFMNKQQIFIFGLVTTLYIPCIAAISVLIKELSWKTAVLITLFTITLAVVVGGLANQALNIFHLF